MGGKIYNNTKSWGIWRQPDRIHGGWDRRHVPDLFFWWVATGSRSGCAVRVSDACKGEGVGVSLGLDPNSRFLRDLGRKKEECLNQRECRVIGGVVGWVTEKRVCGTTSVGAWQLLP